MENKLDQVAILEYVETFTNRLIAQAFEHKKQLNGQGLLSLSPVKQVNLLVVKAVFFRWKEEVSQLKSPYFNYQAEEVRKALGEFMNVVSQHISVSDKYVRPLLRQATQETIYLVVSPYDFYYQLLSSSEKSTWSITQLNDILKYIKINRHLLVALIEQLQEESQQAFDKNWVIESFTQLAKEKNIAADDVSTFEQQFSQVVPFQVSSFVSTGQRAPVRADAEEKPPSVDTEPKGKSDEQRTLNDSFNKAERSTLADQHQQRKIESLSRHISVNQKFMFVGELFAGNTEAFTTAVELLDQQNTYAEAVGLVRREYAQQYRWKMDSEEVLEFMELVAKRF